MLTHGCAINSHTQFFQFFPHDPPPSICRSPESPASPRQTCATPSDISSKRAPFSSHFYNSSSGTCGTIGCGFSEMNEREVKGNDRNWKKLKGNKREWNKMNGNEWNERGDEIKWMGEWKEMKGNKRKWQEITGNEVIIIIITTIIILNFAVWRHHFWSVPVFTSGGRTRSWQQRGRQPGLFSLRIDDYKDVGVRSNCLVLDGFNKDLVK